MNDLASELLDEFEKNSAPRAGYSIGQLIERHTELKNFVEAEQEKFDAEMKPFKEAMKTIANTVLGELNAQGVQNFKSEEGTAFKRTTFKAKVADRDRFLPFVAQGNWEFVSNSIPLEPVEEFYQKHGSFPPGIDVEQTVSCVIRRS